jgi:cell division protein FtsL
MNGCSFLARLNVALAAMLVVAALLLVTSQHRARKLSTELERAQGQMRELDVRYSQLQLEISRLAKPSLVDSRVRKELKMIPLSPERTLYLKEPN